MFIGSFIVTILLILYLINDSKMNNIISTLSKMFNNNQMVLKLE